ncbi:ribonuclease H-like domain-containing protein [Tanacetum coccineum]|uniref:Ribonuclease H-like domain-containing protein n=1 Tax=Tanacetum coccineum TaxID=301880 RepID=A0ABQ5I2I7_9ASTR
MSSFKRKNACLFANLHQEYNIKDFSEDELEEDDDVVEEEELGVVYFDKFPFSIPNKSQMPMWRKKLRLLIRNGANLMISSRCGSLDPFVILFKNKSLPRLDPTWHMDAGASSDLNFNASNLSTIFNNRLFSSVHVDDEFEAFGFLVKNFLTRHILLRCDSSSDLYPVTKPSTTLTAFLSTIASTWHQRLGRPDTLKDPQWSNVMYDEYNVLVKNGTCILVPRPTGVNMVQSMWLFKHKFHANGTLSRYKARLVANGSSQKLGIDVDETFSPVVKPATIRTVLNDTILTASSTILLQQLIRSLHSEFDMTNLGALNYFLGVSAIHHPTVLYLSQRQYASQLLERAHMANFLQVASGTLLSQNQTCHTQFSETLDYGLHLYSSFITSFVGYTNADWVGCPSTRQFTFGYYVFMGDNLLSWSSKRQHTLSRSSAKAEYQGVTIIVAETAWIRNLLRELHSSLSSATLVYCDNVSAIYLSVNHVQHQWTKHIEIDIHFVRDIVTAGQVRVLHVPSRYQFADIFTKGLPSASFEEFRSILSVRHPLAQTAGAY